MKTLICVVPSGGISAPTSGPVAAGSTAAAVALDTNAVGQGGGPAPCLTSFGAVTPYAADLNGPSGGFSAGAIVVLAQTSNGHWWVQAAPGWQSSLTSVQVQQQNGFTNF
jgi:hypothetical protein